MARARMPVADYSPPALDLTQIRLRTTDRRELEQLVRPIAVDDERFAGIVTDLGKLVALWRIERGLEVEPTPRQFAGSVAPIARAARALGDALALAQNPKVDEETDPDPLAGHASDRPWAVEGLFEAFERAYGGQTAGKEVFNGADEAFAHLVALVQVLARAAEHHCCELQTSEERDDPVGAASANRRLFERLVPIYEEMFGTLGRSGRSPGTDPAQSWAPTGPATRFFGFVFGRLLGEEAPTAQTLSTWIRDAVRK